MGFLNRLLGLFTGSSSTTRPRNFAAPVSRGEDIARFVCHTSQLYSDGSGVKPGAYLPRDGKTSIFRLEGLRVSEVRLVGAAHLRSPPPIAHAVSVAGSILDFGLMFDPNNDPERHADIVGWPVSKEEQKLLAVKIAGTAKLLRYT